MSRIPSTLTCLLLIVVSLPVYCAEAPDGSVIYRKQCDHCHGKNGEGVKGEYEEPLYGDKSIKALARYIHSDMPEDEPEEVAGPDAEAVAKYIYESYYSPAAWLRNHPPRIDYSHLTVRQHETSLMDLLGPDHSYLAKAETNGLKAAYYSTRNFQHKALSFERVDPVVSFDVGTNAPAGIDYTTVITQRKDEHKWIPGKSFAVKWTGSVVAPETGDYEFIVISENGFRLQVNQTSGWTIDNFVAASDSDPVRRSVTLRLLGGRSYHLHLEMFRYLDKTASMELRWKPPHGVEEVIPARVLLPKWSPARFVMATRFPPDDGSVGYPRGTSVSAAWQQATALAALEAADYAVTHRYRLAGTREDAEDREVKIRNWCTARVARAWRRPLSPGEQKRMIGDVFKSASSPAMAVRKVMLKALMSPHFLYTEPVPVPNGSGPDDYRVASRLAAGLWDSLPDKQMKIRAEKGQLSNPQQVRHVAQQMLRDPRALAKMNSFFERWLMMEGERDPAKNPEIFPEFDADVISDLRTSLQLMIQTLLQSNHPDYRKLFRAEAVYMNENLAAFYGRKSVGGTGFYPVRFDDGPRAGILTHPYLLATLSYSEMTSPIHRGVFVTRNLLGRHLKAPPDDVAFESNEFDPKMTMREKVMRLTRPQDCRGCHDIINPLGFTLEHYDAVGRFRTHDNKKPIVSKEAYETPEGRMIRFAGVKQLAEHIVTNESSHEAFVLQMFNQISGQPVHAYGEDALKGLVESFRASGYNIMTLAADCAVVMALREGGQGEYQ